MSVNKAIRARVLRMLGGDVQAADLRSVLADLRFKARTHPQVKEVGHFDAHRENKDNGLVRMRAHSMFTHIKFYASLSMFNENPLSSPMFRDGIVANFDVVDPILFRTTVGVGKKRARRHLNTALAKLVQGKGGSWEVTAPLILVEEKMLNFLATTFASRAEFSDASLVAGLKSSLTGNDIFDPNELADIGRLKSPLALHTLTAMHGSTILFPDGTSARPAIRGGSGATLEIGAHTVIPIPKEPRINLALFATSVPTEVCEGRLLENLPLSDPDTPVEAVGDRLRYLE